MAHSENELHGNEIAIIGMAGRFPGAPDIDTFWQNLKDGVEAIVTLSDEELMASGVESALLQDPNYVKRAAALEDADCFDAAFFGYTPREAELMDPQQRVFLECAHAALEHAGYDPERYAGLIGVFGAVAHNSYLLNNIASYPELRKAAGSYGVMLGNDKDFPATRVAYKLNLRGPAVNVQTACSSSAVAIHLACQSLLSGDSDLVLVGGGRILAPSKAGYLYIEGGTFAPDGHCRAFDADAKGMVRGSGVGFVVLKRLAEALQDGDSVHAVIKGSAINNDGADKIGFTAPSVGGQSAVVTDALAVAEVSPDTVSYIEAHGTGTPLGDPIEVSALSKAFGAQSNHKGFCALGSVKTNVGHLDAGAGVTGVIKTVLALEHKQIPPSLNFKTPNPQIDFVNSPFFVNDSLKDWPRGDTPRRAGVNSLGLGGTNAHIVLEEAPETELSGSSRSYQLLLLSAKTETALNEASSRLARHVATHPDSNLADIAFTLQTGRQQFKHRRTLVCSDLNEAGELLTQGNSQQVITQSSAVSKPSIAFMFSGQGAQYVHMAAGLYKNEPVFSEVLERCATLLKPHLDFDLLEILYPREDESAANEQLSETAVTQPALFAVEYALAQLWISWGVKPAAMIGHSLGEYVAACLAGVFSLESALKLVAVRGRLMQARPSGTMLSVPLPEEEVLPLLTGELSLAVVNTKRNCVVAGTHEAIEGLEKQLAEREIEARALHTSHAFHSAMMEPILADFREEVRQAKPQAPTVPFVSNVTGDWITAAEATDPAYWARHIRQTVRFADGLDTLLADSSPILLEVGPGQTLASFAKLHPAKTPGQVILTSLRHPKETMDDKRFLLNSLGRLWLAGAEIDWSAYYADERRQRVPLPTYPFERKRYWLEPLDTPTQMLTSKPATERDRTTSHIAKTGESQATMEKTTTPEQHRKDKIIDKLKHIIYDLSGLEAEELDIHSSFLQLGLDSLFLTQANTAFQQAFDVKITFRQLFDDTPNLDTLAAYIDSELPADALSEAPPEAEVKDDNAPEQAVANPNAAQANLSTATTGSQLERLVQQQLELMTQQLELLKQGGSAQPSQPLQARASQSTQTASPHTSASSSSQTHHGPWKPLDKSPKAGLSERQQQHIDALTKRYTERTRTSKELTQLHRPHLADPRTVAGFRLDWKELVYPIVVARSSGSRFWDVDGNEYIDVAMGFGVNLFGHSPTFVTEAVKEQLEKGVEIGPQSPLAGEVAELICEVTGMERAAFCNTGSEAVLAALRMARTVSGKTKIVTFAGDYHGIFDEVLARGIGPNNQRRSVPIAPGIPPHMVDEVIVLDYGEPESLDIIRKEADNLAAVLVEPIQSRHPNRQPKAFLQELRRLTAETGIALIFDEMITGFRAAPGGIQELFGIEADIATYGKVAGGGFPIGIVAGKRQYLDALDGGMWQYGDDSIPEVGVTWFAGTFVRHPVALAAARAVLQNLKACGSELQQELSARTTVFVSELNEHYAQAGVPIYLEHFSSWFLITFKSPQAYASLFYTHLRDKGIHITEGRAAFLSTAHSQEDIAAVSRAFKEAAAAMQDAELFPSSQNAASHLSPSAVEQDTGPTPLLPNQHRFLHERQSPNPHQWNITSLVEANERLEPDKLKEALQQLIRHHDALRLRFIQDDDGWRQVTMAADSEAPPFSLIDLSELADEEQKDAIESEAARLQASLNLTDGPLFQVVLFNLGDKKADRLLFIIHHLIIDGPSWVILWEDFQTAYGQLSRGEPIGLPAKTTAFKHYADRLKEFAQSKTLQQELDSWLALPWQKVHSLPLDYPNQQAHNTNESGRALSVSLSVEETRALFYQTRNITHKVDLLLTALVQTLASWAGTDTLLFDVMGHGRGDVIEGLDLSRTVGFFISYTPMAIQLPEDGASPVFEAVSEQLRRVFDKNMHFDLLRYLSEDMDIVTKLQSLPRAEVLFNYEGRRTQLASLPKGSMFRPAPEHSGATHGPDGLRYYPLAIYGSVYQDQLSFNFVYSQNLHKRSTIDKLAQTFMDALRALSHQHQTSPKEQSVERSR